jgi:hypothetical protein
MAARGAASSPGLATRRIISGTRAFSFASVFFHVKEKEEKTQRQHP